MSGANRGPSSIQNDVLCGATTYAPEKIRCASGVAKPSAPRLARSVVSLS